jgi:hypothetical protein
MEQEITDTKIRTLSTHEYLGNGFLHCLAHITTLGLRELLKLVEAQP